MSTTTAARVKGKPGRTSYMLLRSRGDLKATMAQRRLGYTKLATRVGCHRSFIYALARGSRNSCTPELAVRIETELGVAPGRLFKSKATD